MIVLPQKEAAIWVEGNQVGIYATVDKAGTAKLPVSCTRPHELWVGLWVGKMSYRLGNSSLDLKRLQCKGCAGSRSVQASDLQEAMALKALMSRRGGAPNIREYSRLNCDGLS